MPWRSLLLLLVFNHGSVKFRKGFIDALLVKVFRPLFVRDASEDL
jgi:hypothetical protein